MRLTIVALGHTFELSLEATTDEDDSQDEDDGAALNGGTTAAMPMGFTASWGDQRWEKSPELE